MATGVPADTTTEVFNQLVDQWRAMSPYERAVLADQLSRAVVTLAEAGIRANNPGIAADALVYELARRRYGDELAHHAYPRHRRA